MPKLLGKKLGKFLKSKQGTLPPANGVVWRDVTWSSREYAAAKAGEVIDALQRKNNSFGAAHYVRFDRNWLLITDKNTFDLMNPNEFREATINLIDHQIAVHLDASYFVTRLRTEDVLFQLSSDRCQVIGRLPVDDAR